MKKTLLIMGLSVPALASFSQQDSLLKKFKYRIDHYRAINFNFAGSGSFNQSSPYGEKLKTSYSSGTLGASLYTIKSTDRILRFTTAGLFTNFSNSRNRDQVQTNNNRNFALAPQASIENRWYHNNKYLLLGAAVNGNYGSSVSSAIGQPEKERNSTGIYTLEGSAGIGTGRLENVRDMQNALWLNRALTASNSFSKPLSDIELNELGRIITQANNTRVLDNRRRTQFVLKTVDQYLQQKGLISKTDIDYFSNLNDILFFAFNNPRYAGTEKFIRLTPSVTLGDITQKSSNAINQFKHRINGQTIALSTGISRFIPASLTHQNNYGISARLKYTHADIRDRYLADAVITDESKGKTDVRQAGLYLFYEHAIYPNTRTTISFNANTEAGYQDIRPLEKFYSSTNVNANLDYFISYRTRLVAGLSASYEHNGYGIFQYIEIRPEVVRLFANVGIDINL